jgi:hypothetical protein
VKKTGLQVPNEFMCYRPWMEDSAAHDILNILSYQNAFIGLTTDHRTDVDGCLVNETKGC